MELGIDVGDLDRVVQVDAPGTVASFLQRLGRTGRRAGSRRNCLFLTTSSGTLLQASALVNLWRDGFVEPLAPPPMPIHVIAQQLMTVILQQGGLGRSAWRDWLLDLLPPMQLTEDAIEQTVAHMLSREILVQDGSILGLGPEGERLYGGKNFMDLLSVFDTPPLFTVFSGLKDLGAVHPISFRRSNGEPAVLSLGGRSWQVTHVDFAHKTAQVIPSEHQGRSRWLGESQPLSYEMCQAIRRILIGSGPKDAWSKRATTELARSIEESTCVAPDALVLEVERSKERTTWWTFAGLAANSELSCHFVGAGVRFDNFSITVSRALPLAVFRESLKAGALAKTVRPTEFVDVKFQECVPEQLLRATQSARFNDLRAVKATERAPLLYRNCD